MLALAEELEGRQGVYILERVLHASEQMTTSLAHESLTGYPVVVKELCLGSLENWKALELFEREIAVLQQLDHPALPMYLDSFSCERDGETRLYLVMSWKEGLSLLERLDAGWQPTEAEILDIARQTLDILGYLHSFNPPVIHRDLKPANLILDEQGQVHLVDFAAVQGVLNPEGGSTIVGTFGYMPPEQFSDRCVPASDLYALGATLLHLLTGKFPSDLPRRGLRLEYRQHLANRPICLPWLDRLLAPEPEQRFATAAQALKVLEKIHVSETEAAGARIKCSRQGQQYQILITPQGWLEGTILPMLRNTAGFVLAWGILVLLFATDMGGQFHFLQLSLALAWCYSSLAKLVQSRIRSEIRLHPLELEIIHSLGRLRYHFRGSPSGFHTLRHGYSWLHWTQVSHFVGCTGNWRPAGLDLNAFESRILAVHIYEFLMGIDPALAAEFGENSFAMPFDVFRTCQEEFQFLTSLNFAKFRPRRESRPESTSEEGPTPRTRYLKCFDRIRTEGRFQLRLARQSNMGWIVGLMLIWIPLSCFGFMWIQHTFTYWLQTYDLQHSCFDVNGKFNHPILPVCLQELEPVSQTEICFCLALLIILITGILFFLRKIVSPRGWASLEADSDFIYIRSEYGKKSFEEIVDISRLVDLEIVLENGKHNKGDLVLLRCDGKSFTLSRHLTRTENLALISDLIDHFEKQSFDLTPAFRRCLQVWKKEDGLQMIRTAWQGYPYSRVQLQADGSQIEIAPHDLSGRLAWMYWLGIGLFLIGLLEWWRFDLAFAKLHFTSLKDFLTFALNTMPYFKTHLLVEDYTSYSCIDPQNWTIDHFKTCFVYFDIFSPHQIQCLRVDEIEALMHPQGAIWGILFLTLGSYLLCKSFLLASISTNLIRKKDLLVIQKRLWSLKWQRELKLNRLCWHQRPDFVSLSQQFRLSERWRKSTVAGYHLDLAECDELIEWLDQPAEETGDSKEEQACLS